MSEASHFEAKHYAMRKSKDGTIISFVVHPDEVSPELNCLPIGCRVMIAWSQIGDDERQIGGGVDGPSLPGETVAKREPATIAAPEPNSSRRKFSELTYPQQAGIRCHDPNFLAFMKWRDRDGGHSRSVYDFTQAEIFVRAFCGVSSRSELSTNLDALKLWRQLNAEYEAWELDQRYADVRR